MQGQIILLIIGEFILFNSDAQKPVLLSIVTAEVYIKT